MNKLLLFEDIRRIASIMGSTPNYSILLEQAGVTDDIGKLFYKGVEEITGQAEASAEKRLEKAIEQMAKGLEQSEDDILRNIEKSSISVEQKIAQISKFLQSNPQIMSKIEKQLISDFGYNEKITKIWDNFIGSPKNGNLMNEWYESLVKELNDVELAKQAFKDIMKDMNIPEGLTNRYLETTTAKIENGVVKIENSVQKSVEDDIVSSEAGTEAGTGPGLENSVETITREKTTSGVFSSLLKSMNKQDLETIVRVYRRIFKTPQALQDEFRRLAESAEAKIKMTPPQHIDYEMKKMADVLIATKKWWKNSPKDLYNQWITNTERPIPRQIVARLESIGDENKFKELFKELTKHKEVYDPVLAEWKAFKKLWPLRLPKLLGGKTPGWFIFKKFTPEDQLGKRLTNLLILKDPRTVEEMKQALLVNGVKQDALRNIISRVALEAVFLPVYLATVGQIFRPVVSLAETGWNALPWTDGDANWIEYNEIKSSNPVEIMKNDWIQCFKSMFPESTWEWIKTVIDPTYIDEFWNNVWTPIVTEKSEINVDELKKKAQQFTDKKSQEFKDWYNTLDEKSKKFVDTLKSEGDEAVEKAKKETQELINTGKEIVGENYTNDIPGFIKWFTEVKKMKLSDADLPYIKSAGNNIYTFEDANGTIYKYEYSGTTFKDKTN